MKITKEELTPTSAKLTISETDFSFVNALRRTLITDTPKMAIEDVIIYENSSILTDEVIAHRLGLLPVQADPTLFVPKKECKCEGVGCVNCTITYTLTKEGPCTVYSGDLQAANAVYKIKDDLIPIVKLAERQRLTLEAHAELGTGKEHAKWQPVSGVGYKNYPIITISDQCDGCNECVKNCPRAIIKAGKPVKVEKPELCTLCRMCEEVCEADAIKIDYEKNTFIFKFETDGSMSAHEALTIAIGKLEEKARDVEKQLS